MRVVYSLLVLVMATLSCVQAPALGTEVMPAAPLLVEETSKNRQKAEPESGENNAVVRERKFYTSMEYHQHLLQNLKPSLAFTGQADVQAWQQTLRSKLREVMAVPAKWDHQIASRIQRESETDEFTCDRIAFRSEPYADVPGYLLKPKNIDPPFPVMICLQGHAPSMDWSLGRAKTEKDRKFVKGLGADIAIQAVRNGWAALVIEQRCFGERRDTCRLLLKHSCFGAAAQALMLGKTITGERVFDVMRAVDFIATQPELDVKRIGCMGCSTGGTVSFYAACVEPRIRLAVVSCSFCTYADSWMKNSYGHCVCGFLPGILKYADMSDLAGLVAPRHLIIVAGKKDSLAKFSGVKKAFNHAKNIFRAAGCEGNILLIAGDGGHQFYPDLAWPEITKIKNSWR